MAPPAPAAVPVQAGWLRMVLRSVAPAVLAAFVAGISIWNLRTPKPLPVTQLAVTLRPNIALSSFDSPVIAISSSGSHLAYVGSGSGRPLLYIQAMDSLEAM